MATAFVTLNELLARIPYWLCALALRIFPAAVFWQSGQTKVEGWTVSASAIYLFREEYKLPLIDPVDRRASGGLRRTFLSAAAGHRPRDTPLRPGAACDDARHSDLRLSRCLADAWNVDRLLPRPDRARSRRPCRSITSLAPGGASRRRSALEARASGGLTTPAEKIVSQVRGKCASTHRIRVPTSPRVLDCRHFWP